MHCIPRRHFILICKCELQLCTGTVMLLRYIVVRAVSLLTDALVLSFVPHSLSVSCYCTQRHTHTHIHIFVHINTYIQYKHTQIYMCGCRYVNLFIYSFIHYCCCCFHHYYYHSPYSTLEGRSYPRFFYIATCLFSPILTSLYLQCQLLLSASFRP